MDARDLAVLLLLPFAALAFVDGIWIHLVRLRLHARPQCRREHALHTARAVLFPAVLVLVAALHVALALRAPARSAAARA
jgi:hypothetical protein